MLALRPRWISCILSSQEVRLGEMVLRTTLLVKEEIAILDCFRFPLSFEDEALQEIAERLDWILKTPDKTPSNRPMSPVTPLLELAREAPTSDTSTPDTDMRPPAPAGQPLSDDPLFQTSISRSSLPPASTDAHGASSPTFILTDLPTVPCGTDFGCMRELEFLLLGTGLLDCSLFCRIHGA